MFSPGMQYFVISATIETYMTLHENINEMNQSVIVDCLQLLQRCYHLNDVLGFLLQGSPSLDQFLIVSYRTEKFFLQRVESLGQSEVQSLQTETKPVRSPSVSYRLKVNVLFAVRYQPYLNLDAAIIDVLIYEYKIFINSLHLVM